MLNAIIRFSLKNRLAILAIALGLTLYGLWTLNRLSIDVFPNLNRPTVSVLTEAHGLAPEEVETLVTLPLESILNGTPGVTRVRSSSGIGISIIHVEFEWDTDTFRNRQLVSERLQLVRERLPKGLNPTMGPVTSIMGEIQFVGLSSPDTKISPLELRTLADWVLRPRLMTISGISQIVVMGGEAKQYQILASSEKLQQKGISLSQLREALSQISENTTGGFIDLDEKEFLIRILGRLENQEQIENAPVGIHLGKPVLVKEVAEVKVGSKTKRGNASVNAKPAVILTVQKQPDANTVQLTHQIDQTLAEIAKTLPAGIKIESDLFKQSRFIEASVGNVEEALRDGAIMVAVVLFLFLANLRTTAITLVTIPLSLLMTAIVFKILGLGINTMTLGGLAVAIGELVDDAIVDVENVYRRLRENRKQHVPQPYLRVIYEASSEVRNSIVFSTIIVVLVFIPLFFLSGIEGRLFAPLGVAYIISLLASLLISLTVTPVLCSYLLPNSKLIDHNQESWVVRKLKAIQRRVLERTLGHPYLILAGCALLLMGSMALIPLMGRTFLPDFNEGTATIGMAAAPGISLEASDALGTRIEQAMLSVPEVQSTIRRTGRAEMDEHAEGVHWSEIDVDFKEGGRSRELVLKELREKIESVGDVYVNIGQPISHRLDHLLSGVRAQIAVKIFGTDLTELRRLGNEVEALLQKVPGVTDLSVEPLVLIPQLKIAVDHESAAAYALSSGKLAEDLEVALQGEEVGGLLERQRIYDLFLRLDDHSRQNPESIKQILLKTLPNGQQVKLEEVAKVYPGTGPNIINREDGQRRIVVSANTQGRDLGSVVRDIQEKLSPLELPSGYYLHLGGQFESQSQASRLLLLFGSLSLLAILLILYVHFKSIVLTLQVMINVPLALIGSIAAIYFTERQLSVATMIAFITLCGIASRNGIMMISHYLHLMQEEGESFNRDMVVRGSLERLVPVLMTALTAALALVPLLLSKGEPGKEILYPVAVVIVGGLISSTLLDLIVTPAVFYKFGRRASEKLLSQDSSTNPLSKEKI